MLKIYFSWDFPKYRRLPVTLVLILSRDPRSNGVLLYFPPIDTLISQLVFFHDFIIQ
jgi:hypothetical protein